ncbi:MAG: sigma-70 family RNA polymerase sigma factor [Phycisphaerae bacterium]|nr:sigma-70 family RNA polymerase sigma factor [Phycisphaerae bacterium]
MEPPSDKQRAATEELMTLVYDELREVARSYFRKQPPGFTLRPTEMVNEACLNLIQHSKVEWQSPEHFRAIATKKIYQVVVDHLRQRNAKKRGGSWQRRPAAKKDSDRGDTSQGHRRQSKEWKRVPLESVAVEWRDRVIDFLDLADALDALALESRRLCEVVKLHWFGGLKHAETARVLGVSPSTVEKDFRYALAWLNRRLAGAGNHAD